MKIYCFHIAMVMFSLAIVPMGNADTFENRPTLALLDETMAKGIVCNDALVERELALNLTDTLLPYCGTRQPYIAALQQELEYPITGALHSPGHKAAAFQIALRSAFKAAS